ncbi:MAG: GNAT family protein [Pseudomonadota bacterium]
MLQVVMPRSGALLRPLVESDADALERCVFGDIEVVRTLMHDVSKPGAARYQSERWAKKYTPGGAGYSAEKGLGLWAIVELSEDGGEREVVGFRGFFEDPALPPNTVEAFVAIGRSHWGRGLSSESSQIMMRHMFREKDISAIYTNVWPLLNPRSEAVQRKVGFEPAGRTTLVDSFGADRVEEIVGFEFWRIDTSSPETLAQTVKEACIKLGQIAAEDGFSLESIENQVAQLVQADTPERAIAAEALELGHTHPAFATFRLNRDAYLAREEPAIQTHLEAR